MIWRNVQRNENFTGDEDRSNTDMSDVNSRIKKGPISDWHTAYKLEKRSERTLRQMKIGHDELLLLYRMQLVA